MLLILGLFGFFPVFYDVDVLVENALRCDPSPRFLPQQELQVHAEVLKLLLLGVLHDRPRASVLLDRNKLLAPISRLGFFHQRGDYPRKRLRLLR